MVGTLPEMPRSVAEQAVSVGCSTVVMLEGCLLDSCLVFGPVAGDFAEVAVTANGSVVDLMLA